MFHVSRRFMRTACRFRAADGRRDRHLLQIAQTVLDVGDTPKRGERDTHSQSDVTINAIPDAEVAEETAITSAMKLN